MRGAKLKIMKVKAVASDVETVESDTERGKKE